jgi:hypothetical protein
MVSCPPGQFSGPPAGGYRDSNRRAAPPTLSAHTRWPLCCNNILSPSTRLPQVRFAVVPGQNDNTLTNPFRVTNSFSLTAANRPSLRQACFIRMTNLFHLDKLLNCTLPGLLLWLAYGNSRFCF